MNRVQIVLLTTAVAFWAFVAGIGVERRGASRAEPEPMRLEKELDLAMAAAVGCDGVVHVDPILDGWDVNLDCRR